MSIVDYQSVEDLLRREAAAQGVNPDLAAAMLRLENGSNSVLDTATTSPKGARGITQVMPETFKSLVTKGFIPSDTDLTTIGGQIKAGVAALKDSFARSNGDPLAALAGYNGSPAVQRAFLENRFSEMPTETQNYVARGAKILGIDFAGSPAVNPSGNSVGVNVDPISLAQRAQAKFTGSMNGIMDQIRDAMGIAKGNAESQKTAYDRAADAAIKKNNVEAQSDVDRIAMMDASLKQFGIELGNKNTIEQAATLTSADRQLVELKQYEANIKNINPVTNFPAWLVGQIQLMSLDPKIKATEAVRTQAMVAIDSRQKLAQQQQQITPALQEQTIRDKAKAANELAIANAQIERAKIDRENLSSTFHFLDAQRAMASDELGAETRIAGMMLDEKRFIWQQGKIDRENEQDLKEVQRYNGTLVRLGMPPSALYTDKYQLSRLPKDKMAALEEMTTGGVSPAKMLVNLNTWGAANLLRTSSPMVAKSYEKIAGYTLGEIQTIQQEALRNGEKIDGEEAALRLMQSRVDKWKNELSTGYFNRADPSNPLRMNARIYAGAPKLGDNSIAQYVKQSANPEKITEKDIILFQLGQIKSGVPMEKVVQEAYKYYTNGFQYQYENSGLAFVGISPKNPKLNDIGYGISADVLSSGDSNIQNTNMEAAKALRGYKADKGFNMMNPASYQRFLTEAYVKYLAIDAMNQGFSDPATFGAGFQ